MTTVYTVATDVGMHGLLATIMLPFCVTPCWCTLIASNRFPYCCHPYILLVSLETFFFTCLCTFFLIIIRELLMHSSLLNQNFV